MIIRNLFFIALIISVAFFFISFNYLHLAEEAESKFYMSMIDMGTNMDSPRCTSCEAYTENPGKISLFFFSYFLLLSAMTFFQFKNSGMRFFALLNTAVLAGMVIWDFVMIKNSLAISFTEVGPLWIVCALLELTFSMIGCSLLIQHKFISINQKQII
jgi:hypothetical protein